MPSEDRNICIIGGSGFIGTALRAFLSAKGFSLCSIGRRPNVSLFEKETYYSVGDYSMKQLENLLQHKNLYAVIDLAYSSVPNTSFDDPVKDFSENLLNVIRHLDFAKAVGTRKFVYISSGGTVYGDSATKEPFQEEAPNFPLSPYGITKLACERYVYMYQRVHGLPALIVRPANIYGPGQIPFRGQGLVATALGLAMKGEPIHVFGDGSNTRDYLYVSDFCTALLDIIEYGEAGNIYNVGTGHGVSIRELIEQVNKAILPDFIQLAQKNLPERPFDVHYNVLNIDKLKQLNSWKPEMDMGMGLSKTWRWMQQYLKS